MASLWKLPLIFVCENNRYAMGTETHRGTAGDDEFHKKLYNVPGMRFNGMDVFSARESFKFAKDFAK